jgi:hypothetical protein
LVSTKDLAAGQFSTSGTVDARFRRAGIHRRSALIAWQFDRFVVAHLPTDTEQVIEMCH